jgi:hypothetical protein
MPNHFHLLVRTGKEPLAWSGRHLMTGYAINFNLLSVVLQIDMPETAFSSIRRSPSLKAD